MFMFFRIFMILLIMPITTIMCSEEKHQILNEIIQKIPFCITVKVIQKSTEKNYTPSLSLPNTSIIAPNICDAPKITNRKKYNNQIA